METTHQPAIEQQRCKNCGGKKHQTELCPHKDKGARCFNCNEFGHIGKDCKANSESTQRDKMVDVKLVEPTNKSEAQSKCTGIHLSSWRLILGHGEIKVKAVICMGLFGSFIRYSCLNKFDCLPKQSQTTKAVTIYGVSVETMGMYELHMTNGREGYYIQCQAVRDDDIGEEMLLGMDFIRTIDIVVRKGKVTIKRTTDKSDEESTNSENSNTEQNWSWWTDVDKSHI